MVNTSQLLSAGLGLANGDVVAVEGKVQGLSLAANKLAILSSGTSSYPEGLIEIEAVLSALDEANQSFELLDYQVDYSQARVRGLLADGKTVEVEGYLSGTALNAYEVKVKNSQDDSISQDEIEIEGTLSALDSTAQSFQLAGYSVNYSQAELRGVLAEGAYVKVEGSLSGTNLNAREVSVKTPNSNNPNQGSLEIKGTISNLNETAKHFSLQGYNVDYTNARVQGQLANAVRVEVKAHLEGDVLQAYKVEREDYNDSEDDNQNKLRGALSQLDETAKSFMLQGYSVDYSNARVEGQLVEGSYVEVKGQAQGSQFIASKVEVEGHNDSSDDDGSDDNDSNSSNSNDDSNDDSLGDDSGDDDSNDDGSDDGSNDDGSDDDGSDDDSSGDDSSGDDSGDDDSNDDGSDDGSDDDGSDDDGSNDDGSDDDGSDDDSSGDDSGDDDSNDDGSDDGSDDDGSDDDGSNDDDGSDDDGSDDGSDGDGSNDDSGSSSLNRYSDL
ncbi:MAG: DUF5666 domain-containing protein [Deinococcales bacterium]